MSLFYHIGLYNLKTKVRARFNLRMLDCAVPLAFGFIICFVAPLRTGLEFGGDEGFELMKAFLVSSGRASYQAIWNDQPPLHTVLVTTLFSLVGPSVYAARLLSVCFGMLLVASLYTLVSEQSNRTSGLLSVVFLISSPHFLQLSASVMLELPAISLAMTALWTQTKYFKSRNSWWLVASGLIFGCALQTKLTALLFAPSLAYNYFANSFLTCEHAKVANSKMSKKVLFGIVHWLGGVLSAFLLLIGMYQLDTLMIFWNSHFSQSTQLASVSEEYAFQPRVLFENPFLLVASVLGIIVISSKLRWHLLIPLVILLTMVLTHFNHRPYWFYYSLHFSIPMAWIAAIGIVEGFRFLWNKKRSSTRLMKLYRSVSWVGWVALVAVGFTASVENVWDNLRSLALVRKADDDWRVIHLRQYAADQDWVFADRVIYAFWAGLPVPPEIAVIPLKRIWSKQITSAQLLESLEQYQPKQILIQTDWEANFNLSSYIQMHYKLRQEYEGTRLYLRGQ